MLSPIESHHASLPPASTEITIMGAGIVGLFNTLQYAKRGFNVTLIDDSAGKKQSYKVGESLLIFTNPFLRTIGDLDPFLKTCFPKYGVWFTHGLEQTTSFEQTSEWGVQVDPHPPHYLYDEMGDTKRFRSSFLDVQMVRPETEAYMRQALANYPQITFLDTARVKEVQLGQGEEPHTITWTSSSTGEAGTFQTRWLLDCSGRTRFLAKKFGHTLPLQDDFQTTAIWAQFSGIADELFDPDWTYQLQDGETTPRHLYTVHLWGEGYWLWVIRLSEGRVSIGATFDQRNPPPGKTPQEQFWHVINRYPLLQKVLVPENMLELRMYRDVQYMTDTFVSPQRYGIVGDAASIIDAYYSQGISLALVTSWHIANVMERDLRDHQLDLAYIQRINENTREDWHMLRNMVKEKYTSAIADSRFFILSHLLDLAIFWAIGKSRTTLVRWLTETEGDTRHETPSQHKDRAYLEEHLFYSRLIPWLQPATLRSLQGHAQAGIAKRARWRLQHGIHLPVIKSVLGLTAPTPPLWKLPFVRQQANLSALDLVKPAHLRPPATSWLLRLPISASTRLKWVVRLRGWALLALFLSSSAYDTLDTFSARLRFLFTRPSSKTEHTTRSTAIPATTSPVTKS